MSKLSTGLKVTYRILVLIGGGYCLYLLIQITNLLGYLVEAINKFPQVIEGLKAVLEKSWFF